MFFEPHHSTDRNHFLITGRKNESSFPLHIHRSFECYKVISGGAEAIINGVTYNLSPGEAVLVFPYQYHEYKTKPNTETWVCIFSPDIVAGFQKHSSAFPKSNKFTLPEFNGIPEGTLLKKALCYHICGIFDQNATYIQKVGGEEDLLTKILIFISKNYTSECTLRNVSSHVGYDYSYISKFFKKMIGTSFKDYLTSIRIDEACRLLSEGGLSIQQVAEASGFGCSRTFNREFLNLTGQTPSSFSKENRRLD